MQCHILKEGGSIILKERQCKSYNEVDSLQQGQDEISVENRLPEIRSNLAIWQQKILQLVYIPYIQPSTPTHI
jgi:hypothetical protein